jgi:ubiquinone/menaquinone biosynthesis C-methylase UbiE
MNEHLQTISDEQKKAWDSVSYAWKKWNEFTMNFLKPMGDAMIKALDIKNNDIVLDIASGTGEPAFSIAAIAKNGEVYATDLSVEMLTIARGYASEHHLNNIQFEAADVSNLPFKNNFFDKISCRMGFMFFPNMQQATNEMFRVCRDGGKVALSVWGSPEENDWSTTITQVLSNYIDIPQPSSDKPGMFRCAKPGLVKQLFENAGFKDVKEEAVSGTVDFGTAEDYWLNRTEMSESTISLLNKTDDATRKKIKDELLQECNSKLSNGKLIMHYSSLIISAER